MSGPETEIAGLVAARICHDLVSPVGSIVNALDLLEEFSAEDTSEERRIMRQASERAGAILKIQRLAFGRAQDEGAAIGRTELSNWYQAALGASRVEFRWTGLDGAALPRRTARALILMVMCAQSGLGLRGRITVALPLDAALPLAVGAEGPSAAFDANEQAWLAGELPLLPEPRQVEFVLLPQALADADARLAVREAEGSVLLNALPA